VGWGVVGGEGGGGGGGGNSVFSLKWHTTVGRLPQIHYSSLAHIMCRPLSQRVRIRRLLLYIMYSWAFIFISPELWSIRGKNKFFYLPSCGCHNSLFNLTTQFIQTCLVDRRDAHTFVTQHTRFYFQTFLVTTTKRAVCKVLEQKNKLLYYTQYPICSIHMLAIFCIHVQVNPLAYSVFLHNLYCDCWTTPGLNQ